MSAAKDLRESKAITEAALESTQAQLAEAVALVRRSNQLLKSYIPGSGCEEASDAFLARFDGAATQCACRGDFKVESGVVHTATRCYPKRDGKAGA